MKGSPFVEPIELIRIYSRAEPNPRGTMAARLVRCIQPTYGRTALLPAPTVDGQRGLKCPDLCLGRMERSLITFDVGLHDFLLHLSQSTIRIPFRKNLPSSPLFLMGGHRASAYRNLQAAHRRFQIRVRRNSCRLPLPES